MRGLRKRDPEARKRDAERKRQIDAVRSEARRNLDAQTKKLRERITGADDDSPELIRRVRSLSIAIWSAAQPVLAVVWGAIERILRAIAPPVTTGLVAGFAAAAGAIALLLDAAGAITRVATAAGTRFAGVVRPVGTVAVVTVAAAVALGVSQFVDYAGVAVGAQQYSGEVGSVAPPPLTEESLKTAGSAHYYALLVVAVLAILTVVATVRGRWRFGRLVGLFGLAGIVVSVVVDAPAGLDTGTAGVAFDGASAQLIEGFWAQIAASAGLLVLGPLLGRYVRQLEAPADASVRTRRGPAGTTEPAPPRQTAPGEEPDAKPAGGRDSQPDRGGEQTDAEKRARERERRRAERRARRSGGGAASVEGT